MSRMTPILPDPAPAEKADSEGSRTVAWLITGLLIVLVPAMIGGICWRWATVRGPTTAVVIRGDASLEGAQIIVMAGGKPVPGIPTPVILGHDNNWQLPILLHPGSYHITVNHHGERILNSDFELDNQRGMSYDLPPMVLIVGNREIADAKIQITRVPTTPEPSAAMDVALIPEDHFPKPIYRTAVHLPIGTYRITAQMIAGRMIADVPFTVERTTTQPQQVDLAK